MNTAKLLILGPPDGPQGDFVSTVSEVKVRSSARTTGGGEGFVPMNFGRLQLANDLDLQLFGFERDRASVMSEALAPGIVGAILLVDSHDQLDPHYAGRAFEDLAGKGIVTVIVAIASDLDLDSIKAGIGAEAARSRSISGMTKENVKAAIVEVLEAALEAEESAA